MALTIPQAKAEVEGWALPLAQKIILVQAWWKAQTKVHFGLPRFPYFAENEGESKTIIAADLDRSNYSNLHRWPKVAGDEFTTPPVVDPSTNLTTTPGVLAPGRTWEVAPVAQEGGLYYEPGGTVAVVYQPFPTWRWLFDRAEVTMSWPTGTTGCLEMGELSGNGTVGWWLKLVVIWEARGARYVRGYGEGIDAASNTFAWRKETLSTGP